MQVCVIDLQLKSEERIGFKQIYTHYSVINIDENKSISRIPLDMYELKDHLNSSYLVMIPKSSTKIMISQSQDLYQSLCLIKDLVKLRKQDKINSIGLKRHSQITETSSLFQNILQKELSKSLHLSLLEELYKVDGLEGQIIKSALESEDSITFRDLPAYFYCNSSLQRHLDKLLNQTNNAKSFREIIVEDPKVPQEIKNQLNHISMPELTSFAESPRQLDALNNIRDAMSIDLSGITKTLEAMFILPLEIQRVSHSRDLEQKHYKEQEHFYLYQYRSKEEATRLCQDITTSIVKLDESVKDLEKIKPSQEAQAQLRQVLGLVHDIQRTYESLVSMIPNLTQQDLYSQILERVRLLKQMLLKLYQGFILNFNHIIGLFIFTILTVASNIERFIGLRLNEKLTLAPQIISLKSHQPGKSYLLESILMIRDLPQAKQLLHEYQVKYSLQLRRLIQNKLNTLKTNLVGYCLSYFTHREYSKQLSSQIMNEDLDQLTYKLPFKMKVQDLVMEKNKAYGERTKEDKEKLEKEAKLEIETNFPSYFDEFQKLMFIGESGEKMETGRRQKSEIKIQNIMRELLAENGTSKRDETKFIKLRLKIIQELVKEHSNICTLEDRSLDWAYDVKNYLRETYHKNNLPSIMDTSDLELETNYNFYHDGLPQEARLAFDPLDRLMRRISDLLLEYESPILNDCLFLANYMLVELNPSKTPLMKILTGLELMLNKLEEWEVYASKKINSCEHEMNLIKQLIIRYRKIQIKSWRNLLEWKRIKMVEEDFDNMVRLAHTIERQVFDLNYYKKEKEGEQTIEFKITELLDLFLRDSTLCQFQSRLKFLRILRDSLCSHSKTNELTQMKKLSKIKSDRLTKFLNILEFTEGYYSQFEGKLQSTIKRLDEQARQRIKTMVDVSKWSVQKFQQVRNNIEKTHKQLHKACKLEEEILIQNVSSLILTSSRKKYIQEDEQLNSLNGDQKTICGDESQLYAIIKHPHEESPLQIIKQISYLQRKVIESKWPSTNSVNYIISDMFERLKIVRDTNKKHIQRRAFTDLLKFMKDEGLQQSFQGGLTEYLINSELIEDPDFRKYYYKSHELMLLLNNSSQVDEHSDMRNVDILRIRGFSQSLIQKVLQINSTLTEISLKVKHFSKLGKESQAFSDAQENNLIYSEVNNLKYQELIKKIRVEGENLIDKINMIDILEQKKLGNQIQLSFIQKLNKKVFSQSSLGKLSQDLTLLIDQFTDLTQNVNATQRHKIILQDSINAFTDFQASIKEFSAQQNQEFSEEKLGKRVSLLQKMTQLFFQDTIKLLEDLHKSQRRESMGETTLSNEGSHYNPATLDQSSAVPQEEDQLDLTIKESQEFIEKVKSQLFGENFVKLIKLSDKIMKFKDLNLESNQQTEDQLHTASMLIRKVVATIEFVMKSQSSYLKSLTKFSYISQRIFIYLIFQGFCGKDDSEDNKDQQEDDKYFEQEGCGMGDGKGGQENVSKEIQDEEQVEGLKNYESDQEQQQEEKSQKDEQDDNDFEMKEGDFEGELEDAPEKEEEEKKEEEQEEDDQMDKVDEMLDNQLWNQNMEDLEEEEQEEQKEEREEVDLGERNLDEQNQLKDQEKELKDRDYDKQERQPKREEEDREEQAEGEEAQEEVGEVEEEKEEGEEEKEGEESEIPLDRDSVVNEEEKGMEDEESHTDSELEGEEEKEKEEEKEGEEEGLEDQQQDQEMEDEAQDQNDDQQEEYKKDFNKQVLEDDKIQSLEQDQKQKQNEQSNLKRNQSQQQQQQKSKENQSQSQKVDAQSQFDNQGSDILYQLAQKIQQQQQQKQDQAKQKPSEQDKDKKTVEQPKMTENNQEQQMPQPDQDMEGGEGMDYEFDEQAEQIQGKLATDKLEEQKLEVQAENEEDKMQIDDEMSKQQQQDDLEHQIQKTEQSLRNMNVKEAEMVEQEAGQNQMVMGEEQEEVKEEDLIGEYEKYRDRKRETEMEIEERDRIEGAMGTFDHSLTEFEYLKAKETMREAYAIWSKDEALRSQAIKLLSKFKQQTQNSASSLCEQLRIVLEPQLSQQLQGDYKTGKRLNMKKVVSFVASNYRNDKIWLRRTLPSKRDYKILLAIDDSLSMHENNLGFFSLEALVTIAEALNRLEVGKVAVAGIRERLDLFQSFEDGYSNERAAFIVSQFDFRYSAQKSADFAMANFVRDTNQMLDSTAQSGSDSGINCPIVIILSDGRFNKANVRPHLKEAREKKYLYIFVILDSTKDQTSSNVLSKKTEREMGKNDGSILSMKSVEKNEKDGGIKLVPYLKDFPFEYYCIVRDIHQLPSALSSVLVQWFTLVSGRS